MSSPELNQPSPATATAAVTYTIRPAEAIINPKSFTETPENTQTFFPTATLTHTIHPTATKTHTPNITPFVSTFEGMMHTPFKGIPFDDLEAIISQEYIQGIESRDIGHFAVDLGSYDYKGQNMYDWPVQAVFSGKVSGIVDNRPPVGNALIIETSFSEIPDIIARMIGIKPDQSLYQLYGHNVQKSDLQIGDVVTSGDIIGHVGRSQTVEAHLHYETRIGPPNVIFESFAYYTGDITPEEQTNYERFRMSGEFKSFNPMIIFNSTQ